VIEIDRAWDHRDGAIIDGLIEDIIPSKEFKSTKSPRVSPFDWTAFDFGGKYIIISMNLTTNHLISLFSVLVDNFKRLASRDDQNQYPACHQPRRSSVINDPNFSFRVSISQDTTEVAQDVGWSFDLICLNLSRTHN